eukprot:CAMPEP_0119496106 /NCGR_PEP_ID=MMETSP1344-20130328/19544_1 /TAXON_ID=236787 /ORGANISM="Florenciella parvula, Strain CCMP2471" /LENGTH=86 /DNA_ID=CAMNT_0007531759 /DNA_START=70 /DNA_END=327 /DNA_ORIENTATION=-
MIRSSRASSAACASLSRSRSSESGIASAASEVVPSSSTFSPPPPLPPPCSNAIRSEIFEYDESTRPAVSSTARHVASWDAKAAATD